MANNYVWLEITLSGNCPTEGCFNNVANTRGLRGLYLGNDSKHGGYVIKCQCCEAIVRKPLLKDLLKIVLFLRKQSRRILKEAEKS